MTATFAMNSPDPGAAALELHGLTRRYPGVRATKTPEEIIEWLQRFHTTLAARLHGGQSVLDLIPN